MSKEALDKALKELGFTDYKKDERLRRRMRKLTDELFVIANKLGITLTIRMREGKPVRGL